MEISINNNTMEFNFANDIIQRKENRALYQPFKLENGAYAVFVKGPNQELLKIEFDKSLASSDVNELGPKYEPKYWATKLALSAIEEPEPKPMSLNDIANYYLTKKGPAKDWDATYIADKNELFRAMPELKNAIPSYTLQIVKSKGGSQLQDTEYNSEVNTKLDAQQTPFSKNKS